MTRNLAAPMGLGGNGVDPNGVFETALEAYARAHQVFHIAPDEMASMISIAKGALRGVQVADLSASTPALMAAIQTGFSAVRGGESEAQRASQREENKEKQFAGTGVALDALGRKISTDVLGIAGGRGGDRGVKETGARFDGAGGVKDGAYWGTASGLSEMRALAINSGVPWAANNPDLLRLGPTAIAAIAAVNLQQQSYQRLTKDAGFKAKDVVALATFAKKKNVDANQLSQAWGDVAKGLTPAEIDALRRDGVGYMAHPDDKAAGQKFNRTLDGIGQHHPDKKPQIDNLKRQLKIPLKHEAAAKTEAAIKEARANESKITKKGSFDAFDSATPTTTGGSPPPKVEGKAPNPNDEKVASVKPTPKEPSTKGQLHKPSVA